MRLHQGNMVAQMGGTGGTAVVTSAFPENNIQIYNSSFMRNMFNKPEVQVSVASLAVSMSLVVIFLAFRSPSPFFFSSSAFGIRRGR
jgi:hypothetical protein